MLAIIKQTNSEVISGCLNVEESLAVVVGGIWNNMYGEAVKEVWPLRGA